MKIRTIRTAQKGLYCFVILGVFVLFNKMGYGQDKDKIVIGHQASMRSSVLEKEIQLSIHTPENTRHPNERYPVLYTFQTHFEMVSGAVKNLYDYRLIPKIMVVSIDNYEFGYLTPTKVESDANSGKADLFLQFFKEELFPFIDLRYPTHPYKIVFSNSWGAMFATYAILAKPDVFHAAIASIPWVRYDGKNRYMINHAEKFLNNGKYNNFLYMSMDNESVILPDLDIFIDVLKKIPKKGLDWEYRYWPEEDHTSTPYRSIYSGLRSLFKGWNQIPPDIAFIGLLAIKEHEAALNQKFGYEIGISTTALRVSAQEQLRNNNFDEAIAIYKYAIEKRPDDAFACVSLGRAYEENGMLQDAKEAFQRAYDLAVASAEPQVEWIKGFLDRIEQKINEIKKK
jgi:predicted alpha/beta superfamily hydrolase